MEEYRIVFAPTAQEDIGSALAWLEKNTPVNLGEWLGALKSDIQALSVLPESCPYAPENGLWGDEELRQLLFKRYTSQYRVIFTVEEQTVRILNIRHSSKRYLYEDS